MELTPENIKPRTDEILIIHEPISRRAGVIEYADDVDQDHSLQFRVLKVSPTVKNIKEGDIVVVPWGRCTPPFMISVDGKDRNVTITSEHEVLGIIEE